jgi:hypothetical protein
LRKQALMKNSCLLLLLLLCAGVKGFSQQKPAVENDSAKASQRKQNNAAWACPACYKITREGGNCAGDKTAKIQLGTYYCQHCVSASGTEPGQCAMCKGATTQMTKKLCKAHKDTGKRTI